MAVIVSTNAYISINGTDFSDHCRTVTYNDGQESREVTAMGDSTKRFRAGLGTSSVNASFWSDMSSGSISQTLASLTAVTSTGFSLLLRKVNGARTAGNPELQGEYIIDGEVNVMDENIGEVSQLTVAFLPYSAPTLVTTTSS